jgi:hypothetical protein
VFRAAAISIVLTLAIGPNAQLLCKAWCHPQAARSASECHHKNSSTTPSVASDESCDKAVGGPTAMLREGGWRGVPSPHANQAIPVPRYQLVRLTIDARPGHEPWREWSLEKRPLATALRI